MQDGVLEHVEPPAGHGRRFDFFTRAGELEPASSIAPILRGPNRWSLPGYDIWLLQAPVDLGLLQALVAA